LSDCAPVRAQKLAEVDTVSGAKDLLDKASAMQHYAERLKAGIEVERPIALGVLKIKAKLGEMMPAEKGGRGNTKLFQCPEYFTHHDLSAYRKLAANRDKHKLTVADWARRLGVKWREGVGEKKGQRPAPRPFHPTPSRTFVRSTATPNGWPKIKAKLGEMMPRGKVGAGRGNKTPKPLGDFSEPTITAYRKLAANRDKLEDYYASTADVPS